MAFLGCSLTLSAQTETARSTPAQEEKQLHILHTADTHSRIEPLPATAADSYAGMGGAVRRATLVEQQRREHPGLLLVDCGDFSQGTPYYNMFKGEVEVKLMNHMGYDAVVVGNHEFDFGLENMARLFRLAEFDVLCANYDVSGTVLEGLVKPYTVVERDGVRIGLFGLSPRLEGLVQEKNSRGIAYLPPMPVAREMVRVLREEQGCDVVVCLSHLGFASAFATSESDETLVAQTEGIDLILGGHTHTFMEKPAVYLNAEGKNVALLHSGRGGVFVGKVTITVGQAQP